MFIELLKFGCYCSIYDGYGKTLRELEVVYTVMFGVFTAVNILFKVAELSSTL